MNPVRKQMLALIEGGLRTVPELQQAAGISRPMVRKAVANLVHIGKVVKDVTTVPHQFRPKAATPPPAAPRAAKEAPGNGVHVVEQHATYQVLQVASDGRFIDVVHSLARDTYQVTRPWAATTYATLEEAATSNGIDMPEAMV